MPTIYYTDGDHYTGDDALDTLWWDLANSDVDVDAISDDLRRQALDYIHSCEGEGPMGVTPESAARIVDRLDVR